MKVENNEYSVLIHSMIDNNKGKYLIFSRANLNIGLNIGI